MRTIDSIILHHSLTKDSKTVSWQAIRRYHKDQLGWSDIGYHFGIEKINNTYEILIGRTIDVIGAHAKGYNKHSIGICFVGNFDYKPPSLDQLSAGLKLVKSLCKQFKIDVDKVYGHCKVSTKTCPGSHFDISGFRSDLIISLGGINYA